MTDITQTFSGTLPRALPPGGSVRTSVTPLYERELDPYARVDEEVTLPAAVYTVPPRPQQVGLALAALLTKVQLWTHDGKLEGFFRYYRATGWDDPARYMALLEAAAAGDQGKQDELKRATTQRRRTRHLRQHQEFGSPVTEAAAVLRLGGG